MCETLRNNTESSSGLSSSVMILPGLVGEDHTHTGDGKLWRPAMNLAAFADSEEDISIQLPFARLQLLCMPSLVGCKKEQIVF